MSINEYGFIRVAASSPKVRVADCDFNVSQIKQVIDKAIEKDVQLLVFPELSITSVSCGILFMQESLQRKAMESIYDLVMYMKNKTSLIIAVGLPIKIDSLLFNVAALISSEGVLGFVPKTNTKGSYWNDDNSWFVPVAELPATVVMLDGNPVPIGNLVFRTPFANIGVEIGADVLSPTPTSGYLVKYGVDIICNLSAVASQMGSNVNVKSIISNQSKRLISGYVYASAGVGESTTDMVFSGSCIVAENGEIINSNSGFSLENELVISDIDISSLAGERLKSKLFVSDTSKDIVQPEVIQIGCSLNSIKDAGLRRIVCPHPFIPKGYNSDDKFLEIFNIQVHSLVKRMMHTGVNKITIGVSGGLDSTLALLVAVKAYDLLNISRENIYGITMPGFGTTGRTYNNAIDLMNSLGITNKEISIKPSVIQHFKDIEHDINQHDLTYENSQARERTQILMDYAGKIGGFVLGTGNMSELALGWATYNGDHMSMYAVNGGVPKTLVQALVSWIADKEYYGLTQKVIKDIAGTPYSPELLPADEDGNIAQKTEHFIGPYELHDFFLYRMLMFGDNPLRIIFISRQAFKDKYSIDEIRYWLKIFYRRFFSQQFKRSCMPDSPRVVSVSLSPRNGLSMPSDAVSDLWLKEIGD